MTRVVGDWLTSKATQAVFDTYAKAGYDLFAVGGCVRNSLYDVPVSDIDMSSPATPDVATSFLTAAGFRVVPTGLDHGTITVMSEGSPYEITTYRKDVATDGRRAVVQFSEHMQDDARRRDFTINALYADRSGVVLDPLNGLQDLDARRVVFIEDPVARIQEDYLRILRFFRFHARFAKEAPDAVTLDAIARNVDGIGQLSVERITTEMLKILVLPDPAPTVSMMHHSGVLNASIPGADPSFLAPLIHVEALLNQPANAITRLAALGGPQMAEGLRLSKADTRKIHDLHEAAGSTHSDAVLGYKLGADGGAQAVALRCALFSQPPKPNALTEIQRGAETPFPIKHADLGDGFQGAAISHRLKQLKSAWFASDLMLSKAQLLSAPN